MANNKLFLLKNQYKHFFSCSEGILFRQIQCETLMQNCNNSDRKLDDLGSYPMNCNEKALSGAHSFQKVRKWHSLLELMEFTLSLEGLSWRTS